MRRDSSSSCTDTKHGDSWLSISSFLVHSFGIPTSSFAILLVSRSYKRNAKYSTSHSYLHSFVILLAIIIAAHLRAQVDSAADWEDVSIELTTRCHQLQAQETLIANHEDIMVIPHPFAIHNTILSPIHSSFHHSSTNFRHWLSFDSFLLRRPYCRNFSQPSFQLFFVIPTIILRYPSKYSSAYDVLDLCELEADLSALDNSKQDALEL